MPVPNFPSAADPLCLVLGVGIPPRGLRGDPEQGLLALIEARRPFRFLLVVAGGREARHIAKLLMGRLTGELRQALEVFSPEQMFLECARQEDIEAARVAFAGAVALARARFPGAAVVVHAGTTSKAVTAGAAVAATSAGVARFETALGGAGGNGLAANRWRAGQLAAEGARLWDNRWFGAAAGAFEGAASQLPPGAEGRARLLALAVAAHGFAAKEALRFGEAEEYFREARNLRSGEADDEWDALCARQAERCGRIKLVQGGKRDPRALRELLAELLDQAVRAAALGQYESAAGRLLRCLEMELQIRLAESTEGQCWNGRLRGRDTPPALRSPNFLAAIQATECPRELPLETMIHALHALGDQTLAPACRELLLPRPESSLRQALAIVRESVVGHGCAPVEKADYRTLRRTLARFFGFEAVESSPLPICQPRWLGD